VRREAEELVVREARAGELDEVAALTEHSFEEYWPLVPPAFAEAAQRDLADVRGRLGSGELLVAELGGRLVGTVTFLPDGGGYPAPGWPPSWCAVRLLAVDPACRGLGIGRRLTAECLDRARRRGAAAVGLHTAPFMASARHIYESLGLERVPALDIETPGAPPALTYRLNF